MISFIIIGKNEDWRLEKCLKSVRSIVQKELSQPTEILYVDSQSTDNSLEISKKYVDKSFLITGVCNAAIGRNIGAKEAKGDILFFLDGDMELREGVIKFILTDDGHLIYPFISGVEYDYLYDKDWNIKGERTRRKFTPGKSVYKVTTGGLFVIEKKLWEEVGGIDNRFLYCEDMDFGIRVSAKGHPLMRMGQLWVNHYTRFYAVRNNELNTCKYSAFLLRKHFFDLRVLQKVFKNNYSAYFLALCLIFILCTHHLLSLWCLIPYLMILCYRVAKAKKRTSVKLGFMKTLGIKMAKDFIFIYSFLTFFPANPQMSYRLVTW